MRIIRIFPVTRITLQRIHLVLLSFLSIIARGPLSMARIKRNRLSLVISSSYVSSLLDVRLDHLRSLDILRR